MKGFYIVLFLMSAVLLGAVAAVGSCKTVAPGRVMVVERKGRFYRVLYPGIHWLNPLTDKIRPVQWPGYPSAQTLPQEESSLRMSAPLTTQDGYGFMAQVLISFALEDAELAAYTQTPLEELLITHTQDILARLAKREKWEALLTVSPKAEKALQQALDKASKKYENSPNNRAAEKEFRHIIHQFPTGQDELQAALKTELSRRAETWGLTVTRVTIAELIPGADLVAEMDRRIRADYASRRTKQQ